LIFIVFSTINQISSKSEEKLEGVRLELKQINEKFKQLLQSQEKK
jgi:hypothetical protein